MPDLDSYVKLMCHFNGTDGSTTIVDDYSDKTITVNGNAQLDTAQKKFGTASLLLDGTGDYLSIADNADFNFGSGDFTVDCQIRINSLPTWDNFACIFAQRATATSQNSLGLFVKNISDTYHLYASFTHDGTTEKTLVANYAFSTGTWYHVAICRSGNWMGLFIDGVNYGNYYIGTNSLHDSTAEFKIGGSNTTTANYFNGWIDEFRLSKGIARYTLASYTPAVSEYTPDSYDKLLLHMDGSNDSTTFTDSATSKTVTANGNAKLKTSAGIAPKFGTAMLLSDGNGDYAKAPSHSDFNYGTGAFTVDFWFNISTAGRTNTLYSHGGTNEGAGAGGALHISSANKLVYYSSGAQITGTTTIVVNTWYHVAFVGNGGADGSRTLKLYLNGTQEGSTYTNNYNFPARDIFVGANEDWTPECILGYIDEFRISKGIERWTSGFTVPSSAHTSDSYTKLLLHFDGTYGSTTFTDSGNTGHTVTAYGNAKLATSTAANPKFGTAMGYFDGDGDTLTLSDSGDWDFSDGDFTVDFWAYNNTISNNRGVVVQRTAYNSSHAFSIGFINDEVLFSYTTNGSSEISIYFVVKISISTWNHFAFTRSNGRIRGFIDGYEMAVKSAYSNLVSAAFYNSSAVLTIGDFPNYPSYFSGYLDELRISKGIARFTPSSFTAPTDEYSALTTPTVTTTSPVTNITISTVDVAGNVSSDGGATITERGFVYGFSANPTTANIKVALAGTTGAMSTTLTGLVPTSTYHVRAFATNSQGTSYGADVEFTMLTPTCAYYDGTYAVNPQWLPSGLTEMRLSWWSKLGQCMVKVKDHTNSSYFTLTDPEGGFGTSVTFDRNANWEPSPDMVSFDVSETGHNGCVDVRPEFYNMSSTEKLYINAPQLTWDRTKKWPQFYVPGKFSSATLLGEGIDDNETGIVGNSHTHSNKSNLDSINQDLATNDNVAFANITGSIIQGTSGKFGDVANSNYAEFESDGTLKFNGNATVFNDLPPIPLIAARLGAANNPSLTSLVGNIYAFTFGVGDYVYGVQEILHEYKEGSNIDIHVHWATNGSEGTDKYVNWEVEYSIANLDNTEPYSATNSVFSGSTTLTTGDVKIPANTTDRQHIYTDIGTDITGTNYKIGAIICYRFRRVAASGSAPSANPFALQLGFHIEQDTCGSRSEYTK